MSFRDADADEDAELVEADELCRVRKINSFLSSLLYKFSSVSVSLLFSHL